MTDYEIYDKMKLEFFKKHGNDFTLYTSPLDEYNRYHKEYVFKDDSVWYEVTNWVYIDSIVDVAGVSVNTESQANKTEYYSTDDSHSRYFYEIFNIKLKHKTRSEELCKVF